MTPHGTPTGYDEGCRGANCAHHHTPLMTCTEAKTRYAGDWEYMRAVDNGTATTEKASYAKPKVARLVAETAKEKAVRPVKVKAAPKPRKSRARPGGRIAKPIKHGTRYGADKGCKEDCPNAEAGGPSCQAVRRARQTAYWRAQQDHDVTPRHQKVTYE
ncbi:MULTISPECIES: hypothetical protein [Cryobacterium]|uniref:HNH endonuclease n=1 Tax=Cryobacterium breve TaxID=1259258 RepID=A0ABY2J4E0_9MICO|nr:MULTISPECIES: hypothetical protein [Cryobacterium]TFC92060.1 hypothetical protein E3T20_12155 [Cryobacterium sp. TmT3-12]TFC99801.1 hypothetical protein E3O65_05350 [Cryobacterium breve]